MNKGSGLTDIFVDTGSTYPALYSGLKTHPFPDLKDRNHWPHNIFLWLLLTVAGGFAAIEYYPLLLGISVTGIRVLSFGLFRDRNWRKKEKAFVETIAKTFEDSPGHTNLDDIRNFIKNAPLSYRERFLPDLYSVLLQIAVETPDDAHIHAFNKIEKVLPVSDDFTIQTKRALLSRNVDTVLEDHLLSEDEEKELRRLIKNLNLPENFAQEELRYFELASSNRKEIQKPLISIPSSIPLVRGEICYAEYKNTRILEEKVISRFQRNRVHYRKLGYQV